MSAVHAESALLPGGWAANVRLTIEAGRFASVVADIAPAPQDDRQAIVLPGMPNLHSHAFQRGMAGLAERRGSSADTFWTWREAMYRHALAITPDQVEAVASQLYVEMLEAGFTRVGEFHYLHHDSDGRPYRERAEMARRIAAAAERTGIGLTLLPVYYARAGFGGAPATAEQRRFVSDLDGFARLVEGCRAVVADLEGANLGIAPHSLRAVTPAELAALCEITPDGPVHIHAAEQVREVEDCLAWSGARPVDWLLDHAPVDGRWCLVHATHMTQSETRRLAASMAVAGLCPITEANLGDGVFNGSAYVGAGGRFGIGTDSNILIGVADELRQLEYSQRLARRARNVMAVDGGSTGRALFESALQGGEALGQSQRGLKVGSAAEMISLDRRHPALVERNGDDILDAWIFAGGSGLVDCVWSRGRKLVEAGRHRDREAVASRFGQAVRSLHAT